MTNVADTWFEYRDYYDEETKILWHLKYLCWLEYFNDNKPVKADALVFKWR